MIKHLTLLKIQIMMDINVDLLQLSLNLSNKHENMSNKKLAEELQKLITRKFNERKVHSSFIENIWGADLTDNQLISCFNKGVCFLLCVIDTFSKYAMVVPLKDRKGITITNAFQKILEESNRKPSKIWVDKGSEFYNRSNKIIFAE